MDLASELHRLRLENQRLKLDISHLRRQNDILVDLCRALAEKIVKQRCGWFK